jgi:hypothetical protein
VEDHAAFAVTLGILVEVLDPASVEGAAATYDAVHLVAL